MLIPSVYELTHIIQFKFVRRSSRNNSLGRDVDKVKTWHSSISARSSSSSLTPSLDSGSNTGNGKNLSTSATVPIVNGQRHQSEVERNQEPKSLIVRVKYESPDNVEQDGVLLYKSIELFNSDRTKQFIRNAMAKLNLSGDPKRWKLIYCLENKELEMDPSTNVFYAVDKTASLTFLLRPCDMSGS